MYAKTIAEIDSCRVRKITDGSRNLITPAFIPSVNSKEVNFRIIELVKLALDNRVSSLMVSAYDFSQAEDQSELRRLLRSYHLQGNVIYADSGGFESYWRRDKKWDFHKYAAAIQDMPCSLYAGFDVFGHPSLDEEQFITRTVETCLKSKQASPSARTVYLIHTWRNDSLDARKTSLRTTAKIINMIWNSDPNLFIGIPERDLGDRLTDRVEYLKQLRGTMISSSKDAVLHVLGCSDFKSMALYALAGADLFDGVGWVKYAIDQISKELRDWSHLELLKCSCPHCRDYFLDPVNNEYKAALYLHNLEIYGDVMSRFRESLIEGTHREFIRLNFGEAFLSYCDKALEV